jgi:hypothetical protein
MFSSFQSKACLLAGVLAVLCASSLPAAPVCTQKPTVWMDEATAASHLISMRKYIFTREMPALARIEQVVLAVTVDRKGNICEAKAVAGHRKLRQAAEKVVKGHWRYRPFLVDWKPVVAQFPVTITFVLSRGNNDQTLTAAAGPLHQKHCCRPELDQG